MPPMILLGESNGEHHPSAEPARDFRSFKNKCAIKKEVKGHLATVSRAVQHLNVCRSSRT
jgi:hypothetical protein